MGSPFGLAYGIGAGLSGVPGAIQQGKEAAINLSMKNMQLEQLRKQMQDEQTTRDVMSQPFTPPPNQTIQSADQEMPMAESAPGVTAPAYQQEAGGPQNTSIPQSMTTPGVTRTITPFSTPQQKIAAEYRQKAQELKSKGMWRSGMELENQAQAFDTAHNKAAREGLDKAVKTGNEDAAVNFLHGMGAVNSIGIKKTEDGGAIITSKDPDGGTHDVYLDSDEYTGLVSGKDPAEIWKQAQGRYIKERQIQSKEAEGQATRESRERMWGSKIDEQKAYHAAMAANYGDRTRMMGQNASNRTKATPATLQVVEARAKNLMEIARQNGEELDPSVAEDQAWQWQKTSATAKDIPLTVARETVKRIESGNNGRQPKPSSPQYEEWKMAHDKVVEAMGKPTAKPAPGRGNSVKKPVARDSAGKLVYNENGKYVYADGTEYVPKG